MDQLNQDGVVFNETCQCALDFWRPGGALAMNVYPRWLPKTLFVCVVAVLWYFFSWKVNDWLSTVCKAIYDLFESICFKHKYPRLVIRNWMSLCALPRNVLPKRHGNDPLLSFRVVVGVGFWSLGGLFFTFVAEKGALFCGRIEYFQH